MNFVVILFSVITFMNTNFASASPAGGGDGGCGGHGGDGMSQEFFQIGKFLYQQIQKIPSQELAKFSAKFKPAFLKQSLDLTHLNTTDQPLILLKNGKEIEVDAKDFMGKTRPEITINRKRWMDYSGPLEMHKKEVLVLHEYLGIVKALHPESGEWDEYSLSSDLLELISNYASLTTELGEIWTKEVLSEFESASLELASHLERGTNYSCLERSLLNSHLPPLVHLNRYSSSILENESSIEIIAQTDSQTRSEMRINSRGDLIVKKTDVENGTPESVLYCSKLGSKAVQMTKFLSESLLPILDTPKTQEFISYQSEIKKLSESKSYFNCVKKKTATACKKTYRILKQLKLSTETRALANAKANINQLNLWLNSLDEKKFLINEQILDLFLKYATHQDYLRSLLDLGDSPSPMPSSRNFADPGLSNFFDSLLNRVPIAYENAKQDFLAETQTAKVKLVESFSVKF